MTKNISIKKRWSEFLDTSFWERYMLNSFQFSAAKKFSEGKLLQSLVYDKNKMLRPFNDFKKEANKVTTVFNDTWLRVEYDSASGQAVMCEKWQDMYNDRDIYPFWIYSGMMDKRERPEHVELEGKIFRIGDQYGDMVYPRNGFNCRCTAETLANDEIKGKKVYEGKEAESILKGKDKDGRLFVPENFRYNAGVQGTMPNTGSYFDIFGTTNKASYKTFGLSEVNHGRNFEKFSSDGLLYMTKVVTKWREKYHVNKEHNVIFQNKEFLLNIQFSDNSLDNIRNSKENIELIPNIIERPDEIWATWKNESQKDVILNFIVFGKASFVVNTDKGTIKAYHKVTNINELNRFRKGIILLK